MTIEATLERIAAGIETLVSLQMTNTPPVGNVPSTAPAAPDAAPTGRGRGRPKKDAPEAPPAAPATDFLAPQAPAAPVDDFLAPVAQPAKPLTIEDVRNALVALQKRAQNPERARAVLKETGGVDTLQALDASKFAAVVAAANAA